MCLGAGIQSLKGLLFFRGIYFYGTYVGIPETSSHQADKHTPFDIEEGSALNIC